MARGFDNHQSLCLSDPYTCCEEGGKDNGDSTPPNTETLPFIPSRKTLNFDLFKVRFVPYKTLIAVTITAALAIAGISLHYTGWHSSVVDNGHTTSFIDMDSSNDIGSDYVMKSPCGSTPAEARKNGCKFDIMSFCWLPDECYDAELSQEFDNFKQWRWYYYQNNTREMRHEQAMTGEYPELYVNEEYHLRHCAAAWMKMHRALRRASNAAIDSYIGELNHTKHCNHMLINEEGVPFKAMNTVIRVKYPHCGLMYTYGTRKVMPAKL